LQTFSSGGPYPSSAQMKLPFTYPLPLQPPFPVILPSQSSVEVATRSEPGSGSGPDGYSTLLHSNAFNVEFAKLDLIGVEDVTADVDTFHDSNSQQMNEPVSNLKQQLEYSGSRTCKCGLNHPNPAFTKTLYPQEPHALTPIDSSCYPRLRLSWSWSTFWS
jgi:hypothetical protein